MSIFRRKREPESDINGYGSMISDINVQLTELENRIARMELAIKDLQDEADNGRTAGINLDDIFPSKDEPEAVVPLKDDDKSSKTPPRLERFRKTHGTGLWKQALDDYGVYEIGYDDFPEWYPMFYVTEVEELDKLIVSTDIPTVAFYEDHCPYLVFNAIYSRVFKRYRKGIGINSTIEEYPANFHWVHGMVRNDQTIGYSVIDCKIPLDSAKVNQKVHGILSENAGNCGPLSSGDYANMCGRDTETIVDINIY